MDPSDYAFYTAAASSITDQERRRSRGRGGGGLTRQYSSFDLKSTSSNDDNKEIISVAKSFLSSACPELLAVLTELGSSDERSARDRLVKIGRSVNATMRYGQEVMERKKRGEMPLMNVWPEKADDVGDEEKRKFKIDGSLKRLVRECADLARLLKSDGDGDPAMKVSKVTYGRTQLRMPIVSLGCMRFQQSWNRGGTPAINTPEQLEKECQDNLLNILKHAIKCGVNHIETAKGYGCSEMQLGLALKVLLDEGFCRREDLIIQTKGGVNANMTKSDYKSSIVMQMKLLGVDYVDIFSIHGFNTEEHYDWVFNNGEKGNLIDAVRELKEEGKIRWIGFSTHAPVHVIKKAIETDAFDSINLHYHFMGSYTASGDGDETFEGNLQNVRLAHKHNMGVFIISPYDKGGRLYAPSHLTRELTLPELEPMEYGSFWLWYHKHHCQGETAAPIHTIVCGAARPSDLDQPVLAALRSVSEEAKNEFEVVSARVKERREQVLGKDWVATWQVGLPNYSDSERGFQVGNIVWLYNVIHVFGMLDFAKERYNTVTNNLKKWNCDVSWKENVHGNPMFNWMPGCGYDPTYDYVAELKNVPKDNIQRVIEAMKFVHEWCCPDGSKSMALEAGAVEKEDGENKVIPLEWQIAYDMRPWTAFPER